MPSSCSFSPITSCCKTVPKNAPWPLSKKLEIICAVALGAFAAYTNWTLFAISLAVGGCYQAIKIAFRIHQGGHDAHRPGCGQGFGEVFSQMHLLSPEVVLATSFVTWRHIAHDAPGFVPLVGFFIGMGLVHHAASTLKKEI